MPQQSHVGRVSRRRNPTPTKAEKCRITRCALIRPTGSATPAAGDLVLDRLFDFKTPDRTVPDDFGVLLTSQTIEPHLAKIRVERERYRQNHPQDIAEIEAMAREVAKTKRCNSTSK
jgi:hypothetical protein